MHNPSETIKKDFFYLHNQVASNELPIILETTHENTSSSIPPLSSRNNINDSEKEDYMVPLEMNENIHENINMNNIQTFFHHGMNNYHYNISQQNSASSIQNQSSASYMTDSSTPAISLPASGNNSDNSSVSSKHNNQVNVISRNNNMKVATSAFILPKPPLIMNSRSLQSNKENESILYKDTIGNSILESSYDLQPACFLATHLDAAEQHLQQSHQNAYLKKEELLEAVFIKDTSKKLDSKISQIAIGTGGEGLASSLKRKRNLQTPPPLNPGSIQKGISVGSKRSRSNSVKHKNATPSSVTKRKRTAARSVNDIINRPGFAFDTAALNSLKFNQSVDSLINDVIFADNKSLAKGEFLCPANVLSFDHKMQELGDDIKAYKLAVMKNVSVNSDEVDGSTIENNSIDIKKHFGDLLTHFGHPA